MSRPRRNSAGWVVAVLTALACALPAASAEIVEVRPWRQDQWLVVNVRATDLLDARTRSTVESGLPGSLGLDLFVEEEGVGVVAESAVQRSLELDLWEGTVQLRESSLTKILPSLAAADSAWSSFEALRLIPWDVLSAEGRYRIHVQLRVRPLGVDDRERVARWVSRSDDGNRRDVRLDVGKLLRHLVGGERSPTEAGVTRSQSAFFRPLDLLREAPEP